MEQLRQRQRDEILNRERDMAIELRKRVLRQAEKMSQQQVTNQPNQFTNIDTALEAESDSLGEKLIDILETKSHNLDVANEGSATIKKSDNAFLLKSLILNTDFLNAFNKYATLFKKVGVSQSERDYLYKNLIKAQELINGCIYGFNVALKKSFRAAQSIFQGNSYNVFSARNLFEFVNELIKTKNVQKVTDRQLNEYTNKRYQHLSDKEQKAIDESLKGSTRNENIQTDYNNALKKKREEYADSLGRILTQAEEDNFRRLHTNKSTFSNVDNFMAPASRDDELTESFAREIVDDLINAIETIPIANLKALEKTAIKRLKEIYADLPANKYTSKEISIFSSQVRKILEHTIKEARQKFIEDNLTDQRAEIAAENIAKVVGDDPNMTARKIDIIKTEYIKQYNAQLLEQGGQLIKLYPITQELKEYDARVEKKFNDILETATLEALSTDVVEDVARRISEIIHTEQVTEKPKRLTLVDIGNIGIRVSKEYLNHIKEKGFKPDIKSQQDFMNNVMRKVRELMQDSPTYGYAVAYSEGFKHLPRGPKGGIIEKNHIEFKRQLDEKFPI